MDKLADLSATLAQKYGPDAYAAASAAASLSAWGNLTGGGIALLIAAVGGYWLYRWGRWIVAECSDEIAWLPLGLASVGAMVIGGIGLTEFCSPLNWGAAFNHNIAIAAYVLKLL
jgi:hypothetical protein